MSKKIIKGNVHLHTLHLEKLPEFLGEISEVTGYFECGFNNLTSLEGTPKSVKGDFYCYYNRLTSLQGAPKSVKGDFYCNGNRLISLEGAPQYVGGIFDCSENAIKFTEEQVRAVCEVEGEIYV